MRGKELPVAIRLLEKYPPKLAKPFRIDRGSRVNFPYLSDSAAQFDSKVSGTVPTGGSEFTMKRLRSALTSYWRIVKFGAITRVWNKAFGEPGMLVLLSNGTAISLRSPAM